MAISTFAELKTAIATWTNRDDLTDYLGDFIALAEARLNRTMLTAEREGEVTSATSAAEVTLPTDFYGIRTLYIEADPRTVLEPLALGELRSTYPAAATGLPQHYAIASGNVLTFGPAPDAEYTYNLNYWKAIPALASNSTNWLLTAYPDVYLAAALVEAFMFIMDETRAQMWDARASKQIEEIMRAGRRKSQGGAPRRLRAPSVV